MNRTQWSMTQMKWFDFGFSGHVWYRWFNFGSSGDVMMVWFFTREMYRWFGFDPQEKL